MSVNVTYLLGAGASANSLPVVEFLPQRMGKLIIALKNESRKLNGFLDKYIVDLEWLRDQGTGHSTIDTFAKKLYLTENITNLERLKMTLSIYFLLEQFMIVTEDLNGQYVFENSYKERTDIRYDTFLASILLKGGKFPPNIKVITWNYDAQIEITYNNYLAANNLEKLQTELKSYPGSYYSKSSDYNIIHLNGVAGVYEYISYPTRKIVDMFYPKGEMKNDYSYLTHAIKDCLDGIKNRSIVFGDIFSFGWESSNISSTSVESAIKIMQETDYLVIIGYSFPFFNREIDKKILNRDNRFRLKKIYFQDPKLDGDFLINQFEIPQEQIVHVSDVRQFFLPHEL